jgi:hypothetical protein
MGELLQLRIIIQDQLRVKPTREQAKGDPLLNDLNLPHDLPMEIRDLMDRKRVHREGEDLILATNRGRGDASHPHPTGAVQLKCVGGRGVLAINRHDIVFEFSILSATIARGPAVSKLIGQGDQETGFCGSGSVDLVTEKHIACRSRGDGDEDGKGGVGRRNEGWGGRIQS